MFFCTIQTQWRTTSIGLLGLDYVAVLAVADLKQVEDKQQLLTELQWIEAAVLSVMSERMERGKDRTKHKNQRHV
jgi:hypothetical protein